MPKPAWKRCLKSAAVSVAKCLPPLPGCFLDTYVSHRVGSTSPAVAQVDYVSLLDGAEEDCKRLLLEELPVKPFQAVRLVIISDTHERHRQVHLPAGDVFLHCGDISMSSSLAVQSRGLRVLQDFNEWLATVPCKEKVVIGGNHDMALLRLGAEAQSVISNATILNDTALVLEASGLKVYGTPFSEGDSHNNAWQVAEPTVSGACDDADIVLSHESAASLQEKVLARCRPAVWASGHEHNSHGARFQNGTLFANAAIQDGRYNPTQPAIVVDLALKRK